MDEITTSDDATPDTSPSAGMGQPNNNKEKTMPIFNVHIYREMRLYFPGVTAESPEAAAQIASARPTEEAAYTAPCDGQDLSALVDVAGDEEFAHSTLIDFEPEHLCKNAQRLLASLKSTLQYAEEMLMDLEKTDDLSDFPWVQEARDIIAEVQNLPARADQPTAHVPLRRPGRSGRLVLPDPAGAGAGAVTAQFSRSAPACSTSGGERKRKAGKG